MVWVALHRVQVFFYTDSITLHPDFNFLNKINRHDVSDSPNFFSNSADSPYENCAFNCDYTDICSLSNNMDNNKFRILTLNVQSLQAKFSELKELIVSLADQKSLPDIICLQELWQFNELTDFIIPGYKPIIY